MKGKMSKLYSSEVELLFNQMIKANATEAMKILGWNHLFVYKLAEIIQWSV